MEDTKTASIGRLGGKSCSYILPEGATFNDLVAQAQETLRKGETLTLDGEPVDGKDEFDHGDEVVIMPSTTGA